MNKFGYELTFKFDNGFVHVDNARPVFNNYNDAEWNGNHMRKNEELNRKNCKVSCRVVEFN